jgi:hypothetical protein
MGTRVPCYRTCAKLLRGARGSRAEHVQLRRALPELRCERVALRRQRAHLQSPPTVT